MKFQFFITRAGNHFMQEIAEFYVQGLCEAGFGAELVFDQIPKIEAKTISIVVAPHEFYPLFLEKQFDAKKLNEITAQVILLNTEQPGTSWFKKTVRLAIQSRGVIDLNQLGVEAFQQRGIPALYWPIPYTSLLEAKQEFKKEIDFVFLGYASSRRTQFFAQQAEFFAQFENRFIFSTLQDVRTHATPGCCFGEARNELLRKSKVLINIHGSENRYFEWHRALVAIANGCVFVTDDSEKYEPLISGEHIIVASYEHLKEICADLMGNEEKRTAMAQKALIQVKATFSPQKLFNVADQQIKELQENHILQRRNFTFTEEKIIQPKKSFFSRKVKTELDQDEIKLIPKRDIKVMDHGYLSLGEDPQFRLQKSEGKWSEGWYVLTFHLKSNEGSVLPEVYVTARGDFRDSVPIPVKETTKGKFRQLIRLSSKVKEIRLDPMSGEGSFELSHLHLKPLEKYENASSLMMDYLEEELGATTQSQIKLQAQRSHFLGQHKLSQFARSQGLQGWEIQKNDVFDSARPLISVVVTLYNYASYIECCLGSVAQSVLEPPLSEIEIIVVDDASQDEGATQVATWMKQTKMPCALVKKVFNTGLAESRNLGIELSRAPYVFILDADNKLFSKGLSHLYHWVKKNNWDFGFGILQRFDSEKNKGLGLLSHYEWNEKHLLREPYIDAMALFKREAILACGGYQTSLGQQAVMGWEDYDLWLHFLEKGFLGGIYPNFVGAYRVHASSMIRGATEHLAEIGNYFQKRYAHLADKQEIQGKWFGWIKE